MVHYDLHEQDQISNLKYIWERGGKYLFMILIFLILLYTVFEVIAIHKNNKAIEAASIYDSFIKAQSNNKPLEMNNYNKLLQTDFKSTEYATIVSLEYAKYLVDKKNLFAAEKQLLWVINKSADDGLKTFAQLNLINVLIDENKVNEAKQILSSTKSKELTPLLYIKRGDIYVVMNNLIEARKDYDLARKNAKDSPEIAELLKLRTMVMPN